MRRPGMHAGLNDGRRALCALLLCCLGCRKSEERVAIHEQSVRARAEAAIRTKRAFDGDLLCESRHGGRLLMTFQDNPSVRGTQDVDVDRFPMILIDTTGTNAKVIERQQGSVVESAPTATERRAPASVDSAAAVATAMQMASREATLHCVISSERMFLVEVVVADPPRGSGVRGQTVLVPRDGPAQVIGVFAEPEGR